RTANGSSSLAPTDDAVARLTLPRRRPATAPASADAGHPNRIVKPAESFWRVSPSSLSPARRHDNCRSRRLEAEPLRLRGVQQPLAAANSALSHPPGPCPDTGSVVVFDGRPDTGRAVDHALDP